MIVLYINNEHCTSVEQLKGYFSEDLTPESDTYADLLDYGRHGDIVDWLLEQGEQELSSKVASISADLCDSAFYAEMKGIITGVVSDTHLLKPSFDQCFSCDISIPSKSRKEVVVLLSITPKTFVNENYEIKVSCGWGTKARMFNPSLHEGNTNHKESVSFHSRTNKEIGKIVVSIENEQVFEESIQIPKTTVEPSVQSSSGTPRDELVSFLKESNAPQFISDIVSWAERASQIKEAKKSLIECDNIKASNPKSPKTPEYIRTVGGLIPKEEWIRRREQERLSIEESQRKIEDSIRLQKEEEEREAMRELWRKKHGKL